MFKPNGDPMYPHNPGGVYDHGLEQHRPDPTYVGPEPQVVQDPTQMDYSALMDELAKARQGDKDSSEKHQFMQRMQNIGEIMGSKKSFGHYWLRQDPLKARHQELDAPASEVGDFKNNLVMNKALGDMRYGEQMKDPTSAESINEAEAFKMAMPGMADRVQPGKISGDVIARYKGMMGNDHSREDAQKHGHTMAHHESEMRRGLLDQKLKDKANARKSGASGSFQFLPGEKKYWIKRGVAPEMLTMAERKGAGRNILGTLNGITERDEVSSGESKTLSDMRSTIDELGAIRNDFYNNKDNVGLIDGNWPDWARTSKRAQESSAFRARLGKFKDNYQKTMTGLGASEAEAQRLASRLPDETTPEDLFQGKMEDSLRALKEKEQVYLSTLQKSGKFVRDLVPDEAVEERMVSPKAEASGTRKKTSEIEW